MPDVPSKLIRPQRRGSLTPHKKRFWDIVLNELGGMDCIYTGRRLNVGQYDMEHFIPYQFVAHDQMWNLIPADPQFNNRKSDKLPVLADHFDAFYRIQYEAVSIIRDVKPKNKYLDDYLQVSPSQELSPAAYRAVLEPLVTIASNNGFQFMEGVGSGAD